MKEKTSGILRKFISIIAISMSVIHLITYIFGLMPAMQQRSIFLLFTISLVMLRSVAKDLEADRIDVLGLFLLAGNAAACIYIFCYWQVLSFRVVSPRPIDIVMGIFIIAGVVEATRKELGPALPVVTILFIIYGLVGGDLPVIISCPQFTISRIVSHLTMETAGIFGTVLGTAAKYIFVFVIFGAFLETSGASAFFLELADAILGRTKGSGAKVTTMSSGLFGMISGSAVANVMAIGPITMPMMKQNKFGALFSGAVTAISGTGGQLIPPIMGTAAFIIAETLAIPYGQVTAAALIPGILYYLSIWVMINLYSNKLGIKGTADRKPWKPVLKKGFFYIIPLVFLIITISVMKWSPMKAGIWSIFLLFLASQFNRDKRMGIKEILTAFEKGAIGCLCVGVACASAGIVIGILSLSGLGLKFSSIMIVAAGGKLAVLLILTMIAGLILGMGMTTTSVYIVLSVLVAPALVSFGIPAIAAHLFVFYFGILSSITPPVATATFAAASILEISPMKLGLYTSLVALPIYLLPFLFILNPELLMIGSGGAILLEFVLAVISVISICCAIIGYYKTKFYLWERVILAVCSIGMLFSSVMVEISANVVIAVILLLNYLRWRRGKKSYCIQ